MPINANQKFIKAILNRVSDYEMTSERKITNLDELTSIIETVTGYSLSIIKNSCHLIDGTGQEYSYANGLKYLISEVTFKRTNGNIFTIEQRTLTSDYKNVPIVNIIITRKRKAIQQLLISSGSKDEIFPESMKNIQIETTEIYVNNECGSVFETYTNINDNSLMLEKYMQYYPISHYEASATDLLRLCGCGTRYLEIIYHKNEPIYAQLSNKYKVEMANFDPNSSIDAKIIVGKINDEVDSIVSAIHSLVSEHINKTSSVKKLEKK